MDTNFVLRQTYIRKSLGLVNKKIESCRFFLAERCHLADLVSISPFSPDLLRERPLIPAGQVCFEIQMLCRYAGHLPPNRLGAGSEGR
jgi:hypothetical protein